MAVSRAQNHRALTDWHKQVLHLTWIVWKFYVSLQCRLLMRGKARRSHLGSWRCFRRRWLELWRFCQSNINPRIKEHERTSLIANNTQKCSKRKSCGKWIEYFSYSYMAPLHRLKHIPENLDQKRSFWTCVRNIIFNSLPLPQTITGAMFI